jgi:hypothetical protein
MKRTVIFLTLLAGLSVVSGYLLSKASWIGRVGMTFFYKEYNLLKIWWQGALAVYLFLLILFLGHTLIQTKLPAITARLLHIIALMTAITALYFTYDDFTTDLSHKLLGHCFHYGFYLIWIDWMLMCLFFAFKKKRPEMPVKGQDKTVQASQ